MKEVNPSARVQRRGVGELRHPACCALCGNGTSEKGYVDPDIFYDWEGQVYFCYACTVEMAEAIGCLAPDEAEFLTDQNKELADKLHQANQELTNANSNLSVFYNAVNAVAVDALMAGSNSEPTVEPTPESSGEPNGDGTESEPIVVKSVKKRRPNDSARTTVSDGADAFLL